MARDKIVKHSYLSSVLLVAGLCLFGALGAQAQQPPAQAAPSLFHLEVHDVGDVHWCDSVSHLELRACYDGRAIGLTVRISDAPPLG